MMNHSLFYALPSSSVEDCQVMSLILRCTPTQMVHQLIEVQDLQVVLDPLITIQLSGFIWGLATHHSFAQNAAIYYLLSFELKGCDRPSQSTNIAPSPSPSPSRQLDENIIFDPDSAITFILQKSIKNMHFSAYPFIIVLLQNFHFLWQHGVIIMSNVTNLHFCNIEYRGANALVRHDHLFF